MARQNSRDNAVRKLRFWLGVFFLAIALPAGLLVYEAFSRLKWETVHQHRLLAEELATRIDRRIAGIMDAEETRGFAEYGFLTLAGDPAANFLQRSPLSRYPLDSNIPGLLGYFQIDTQGRFSTPLLPEDASKARGFGIAADELAQRRALSRQLLDILTRNRLLSTPARSARAAHRLAKDAAGFERRGNAALNATTNTSVAEVEQAREPSDIGAISLGDAASADRRESDAPIQEEYAAPQAAFDRLQERKHEKQTQKKVPTSLGRVEDLKFRKKFDAKAQAEKKRSRKNLPASPYKPRAKRKEQSALPELATPASEVVSDSGAGLLGDKSAAIRVSMFESEIDPFDISLLDSGHLVLFRKVWRDGRRYIQGALFEPKAFISGLMETAFRESNLARMSDLVVAYRGNVFSAFGAEPYRSSLDGDDDMRGALLYQTRLSAPLGELEMIFTITRLPVGPGARLIAWLSGIMLLVLCGGFLLMYRLGYGQIALAHQQQDFVSAVSHELKTPLTSIRMYGEMLREGWADENKKRAYYEFIHDESERLSRLIENVLQLARMSRNDSRIDMKTLSAASLMDALRSKVATQVERAGYVLDIACDGTVADCEVHVDADYFIQIMINLVDNAIKFSAKADTKRIELACRIEGGKQLVFSVRDYGPGVAREQMKKIFKLFYRPGNELTRETVGTGIGLALVNQLAQAMGAKVDVVNREPGAEFRLGFSLVGA